MPHPRFTAAQIAALVREDTATETTYPGEYVAFVDEWNGDELTRRVLVHAPDSETFHARMGELDPALAARADVTRTHDPNESVWVPAQTA
jgi:hypothetical protein